MLKSHLQHRIIKLTSINKKKVTSDGFTDNKAYLVLFVFYLLTKNEKYCKRALKSTTRERETPKW